MKHRLSVFVAALILLVATSLTLASYIRRRHQSQKQFALLMKAQMSPGSALSLYALTRRPKRKRLLTMTTWSKPALFAEPYFRFRS